MALSDLWEIPQEVVCLDLDEHKVQLSGLNKFTQPQINSYLGYMQIVYLGPR